MASYFVITDWISHSNKKYQHFIIELISMETRTDIKIAVTYKSISFDTVDFDPLLPHWDSPVLNTILGRKELYALQGRDWFLQF